MGRNNGGKRRTGSSIFELLLIMSFLWMQIVAGAVLSVIGIVLGMHLQIAALAVFSIALALFGPMFAYRYGDVRFLRSGKGSSGGYFDFSPADLTGRDLMWIGPLCAVMMWIGYAGSMGYVQQMLAAFSIDLGGVSAFFRQHVFR
ncbi:MAG: hypothetical protein HGA31_06660 [Candidatus Moranbacteria bacterium]|nr:hypothetical protein [Candidatus Moranbacteria bacterium]